VKQYETEAYMTGTRNRSAWIWVAIAAITLASASRAEASLQNAKAYAHPVLAFLAKSQSPIANPAVPRFVQRGSGRPISSMFRETGSGTWTAILPVFFIGLVSPLNLLSAASIRCLGRAPAAPFLPASFQRPPPRLV
jgi:hypothetical protein